LLRPRRSDREEVGQLKAQIVVRGAFEGLIHSKAILLSGATLLAMWAMGQELTPVAIYSASTLFYLLEMDRVWRFIENAEKLSDFRVTMARFEKFLGLPEVVGSKDAHEGTSCVGLAAAAPARAGDAETTSDNAVVASGLTCTWSSLDESKAATESAESGGIVAVGVVVARQQAEAGCPCQRLTYRSKNRNPRVVSPDRLWCLTCHWLFEKELSLLSLELSAPVKVPCCWRSWEKYQ